MVRSFSRIVLCSAVMLAMFGVAHADDDPLNDPSVQKTLRAMSNASTWGHPDQFGEFAGMRAYAHHEYKDAMKYFEVGAYYADKLSQLSIGLLYANGEGVKKDPVTAYAWMTIAAERDYPEFVSTRDGVKAGLTPEQLAQTGAVIKTLQARYGDAVAQPRMAKQLRQAQMDFTGSRTGYDSGVSQLMTKPSCGPTLSVGGVDSPQAGCGGTSLYAKARWDPKTYFSTRDAEWKASVTVGSLQEDGKPPQPPPAADATTPPATPPQ